MAPQQSSDFTIRRRVFHSFQGNLIDTSESSAVEITAPKVVEQGENIRLECNVTAKPRPPVKVLWFHNNSIIIINHDEKSLRTKVMYKRTSYSTVSILTVQNAQRTDSGTYMCKPDSATGTSAEVLVVNGKRPEAIKGDTTSSSLSSSSINCKGNTRALIVLLAGFLLVSYTSPLFAAY
ncbi:PREDICTED: uncharacterized protein LOC106810161 [Priapulus caudatus]|uniref:Uncharacterized protein LOC106810161 n=1 Tax=Priapulus caudatus TaxID=37621 RepID=A0ABM1E9Q9_PRICU|nr:PREDICTED: uncharacterized protein LOC106810161 [Priapulus caudatus]